MTRWVLAGLLLLGTGAVAQEPLGNEPAAAASAGAGGAADVDLGEWAHVGDARQGPQPQRQLYQRVAKELGLKQHTPFMSRPGEWEGQAVGGGGTVGTGASGCAETLAAGELVTLVSGTLSFASGQVLTVTVPGKGPVSLRANASTCAVQTGREQSLESLTEGTEVRVAFVLEQGQPVARLVHAEPQRPLR